MYNKLLGSTEIYTLYVGRLLAYWLQFGRVYTVVTCQGVLGEVSK
jgi:hypothetical protein